MLTVGSLFSGIGLLDYGLHLAGLRHAWLCEADPWRRGILAQRWPGAAVLDDVRTVGAGTAERVDVIAGGFPCKGASTAGKRNGFDHAETVLWREMARAVGELRPRYVLVENVANILALHDGAIWGEVLGTLASLGYDTVWDCLPAGAVGAPHLRDRVFAIATDATSEREGVAAGQAHALAGGGDTRQESLRRGPDIGPVADADSARTDTDTPPGRPRAATGERDSAATHARGDGIRHQPESKRGGGGETVAGRSDAPAPDPTSERRATGQQPRPDMEHDRLQPPLLGEGSQAAADASRDAEGRASAQAGAERQRAGLRARFAVEWGTYEPAIRRWEAIHGTAPEPLVRRVDDRGAARVERSRLSALGDGVQVQVGHIAGAHIMSLEAA